MTVLDREWVNRFPAPWANNILHSTVEVFFSLHPAVFYAPEEQQHLLVINFL